MPYSKTKKHGSPHGYLLAFAFGLPGLLLVPSAELKVCPFAREDVLAKAVRATQAPMTNAKPT